MNPGPCTPIVRPMLQVLQANLQWYIRARWCLAVPTDLLSWNTKQGNQEMLGRLDSTGHAMHVLLYLLVYAAVLSNQLGYLTHQNQPCLMSLKSIETQVIIKPLLQGKRATKKQSESSITSIDLSSYYPDMNSSHPTVYRVCPPL